MNGADYGSQGATLNLHGIELQDVD